MIMLARSLVCAASRDHRQLGFPKNVQQRRLRRHTKLAAGTSTPDCHLRQMLHHDVALRLISNQPVL